MITVKNDPVGLFDSKTAQPNTWALSILSGGSIQVITRCSNGHIGALDDHEIAVDGTVSPSVVCQREGCTFHEFIRLEDWIGEHQLPGVRLQQQNFFDAVRNDPDMTPEQKAYWLAMEPKQEDK